MNSATRYALGLFAALSLFASTATAAVKHEGNWPKEDKKISIDVTTATRHDAILQVAKAAGWNVVVHGPPDGSLVELHLKDVPASKVLDLVLGDGNWVARRDDTLIDISPDKSASHGVSMPSLPTPPAPPTPPTPPTPPAPPSMSDMPSPPDMSEMQKDMEEQMKKGMAMNKDDAEEDDDSDRGGSHHRRHGKHGKAEDRVIAGGSARIEKGEVVEDVSVLGGKVDVYGEVLGDLAVMGGKATVHDGAYVHGDVSAIGGSVRITKDARVDGEVGVVGGSVDKEPGAKIGGSSSNIGGGENRHESEPELSPPAGKQPWYSRLAESASTAVAHTALLFVLGAILLSLATRRMDVLRAEVAARPMRCFAMGVLSVLAAALALVALCVTMIGVPVAIIGALVAIFGIYAGICATLATLGKGLIAHKTQNQHVHLAVGCAIFLLLSAIPGVGPMAVIIAGLIGFGALVATRLAGFVPKKQPPQPNEPVPGDGPYRTPT